MQRTKLQTTPKGVNRWRKAGSRTLPMLGAAMLFGIATPTLADTKMSFQGGHAQSNQRTHQRAHPGRAVERKLNRVVRKVARDLNAVQPVAHRDRGQQHARNRHDRYNRHDRHYRQDRHNRHNRNDRHNRYDRSHRENHQQRHGHYADPLRADPLYQPMSYRRWSRYQQRVTQDARYVTPRIYQRYLSKYRKHYRHGHQQPYFAGVDRHGRGNKRGHH